ncbi:MAG: RNA polymerase sigma factor SigZ [Pseudomonadota bacterium]
MADVEQVWSDYRDTLTRFVKRRVSKPEDAEDLVQDILLTSHRQLPHLRDEKNLRGWLFRIARNAVTDHYLKSGRSQGLSPEDLWYEKESPDVMQDLERCIAPFIAALSPEDAMLLQAVDLDGLSQKDYAAQLGIRYSTLKSRVKAARSRLYGRYADCCQFEVDHQGAVTDFDLKSDSCKNC